VDLRRVLIKFVLFYHRDFDWNHGKTPISSGFAAADRRASGLRSSEPEMGLSLWHLLAGAAKGPLKAFSPIYPTLSSTSISRSELRLLTDAYVFGFSEWKSSGSVVQDWNGASRRPSPVLSSPTTGVNRSRARWRLMFEKLRLRIGPLGKLLTDLYRKAAWA